MKVRKLEENVNIPRTIDAGLLKEYNHHMSKND